MNEDVRELVQQAIAAAWDAARFVDDPDAQAERLGGLLELVDHTVAQLAGLRMELLREAQLSDAAQVLDRDRVSTRRTTARARADVKLAGHLTERFPLIGAALCDGAVSAAQAEAMVQGLRKLPNARLSDSELARCQAELLSHTDTLGPDELRVLAARMMEIIDPDAADQAEAARLAREERRAKAGRSFKLTPDFHGNLRITGQLPLSDGALLEAQLAALMPSAASYPDQTPSLDARRADALVLLAQLAAGTGDLPAHGGDRPHVHINLDLKTLLDGLGHIGLLGHGEDQGLTPGEARRLACDAHLTPLVLGGPSQPLDVGRSQRLVTRALRIALNLRDQGCAFPHCNAPLAACEAHHIWAWWGGGPTSLNNLVLACPFHHRLIEPDPCQSPESQWEVRIQPATGLPEFLPPTWIDPARKPRQHRRTLLSTMLHHPEEEPTGSAASQPAEEPPTGPPTGTGAPPCPHTRPEPAFNTIPLLEPKDDPWHPDYQPPPRTPPPAAPVHLGEHETDGWLSTTQLSSRRLR